MLTLFLALWMLVSPVPQDESKALQFDVRARQNLLLGKGEQSGREYYDVVITKQPNNGVLIKLPYTLKGGKFSFDLHHRIPMTSDFGLPAEVTTIVEVLTGGTTSLGTFTISDMIKDGDKFEEQILKTSTAEIDKYVTPLFRKTVVLNTRPGPQSVSIVGQTLVITRAATTTRVDTQGTRVASVSNLKVEDASAVNPLKP
jgi:hypothetical protein